MLPKSIRPSADCVSSSSSSNPKFSLLLLPGNIGSQFQPQHLDVGLHEVCSSQQRMVKTAAYKFLNRGDTDIARCPCVYHQGYCCQDSKSNNKAAAAVTASLPDYRATAYYRAESSRQYQQQQQMQ